MSRCLCGKKIIFRAGIIHVNSDEEVEMEVLMDTDKTLTEKEEEHTWDREMSEK